VDERNGGGDLPHPPRMKRKHYERQLLALQIELVKAQYWVKATGERVVDVFEGRDAAGKGGTIKRFREHMNPRGALPYEGKDPEVAVPADPAIAAPPDEAEQGRARVNAAGHR
jgi:polyphosphate kinase 2 (PPK2 family)